MKLENNMLVGYRTYIVSFLIATFGILEMTDWNSFLDNPGAGFVALLSALIMAGLRTITTTPPGFFTKKDE
jgi:hypothetical protein